LRELARQKVIASRKAAGTNAAEQPKYRDRASERRIMHNQPEVPLPDKEKPSKTKQAEGPPRPSPPPAPPVNPGEDQNNVGNKLLKMMGWTEGSGLGTAGEGRVEPVQTAIYAQGAGLGASKGKEVGKYADGYSGYVDGAKDGVSAMIRKTNDIDVKPECVLNQWCFPGPTALWNLTVYILDRGF